MTARLADRRACETFNLECNGLRYTATISRFSDGRVAEVFLSNHGHDAPSAIRSSAVPSGLEATPCASRSSAVLVQMVKLARRVDADQPCHENLAVVHAGKGPHAAELRCANCGIAAGCRAKQCIS
jgi:hypothetical protein